MPTLLPSSSWSINNDVSLEFRRHQSSGDYILNLSVFGGHASVCRYIYCALNSPLSKNSQIPDNWRLNFNAVCYKFPRYKYVCFHRLFPVATRLCNGLGTISSISLRSKIQACRYIFGCHTFGDISTSAVDSHIAVSGCRSSSNSL